MTFPEITFQWVGGATFILSFDNMKVACDPVLCPKDTIQVYNGLFKSTRLESPVYTDDDFKGIDLWLITHSHEDHLDEPGIAAISNSAHIIGDKKSIAGLSTHGLTHWTVLDWYETIRLNIKGFELTIDAVPAIHGVSPVTAYFAGKVNGYYLTIRKDSKCIRIYITGDTVLKKRVLKSLKGKPIDLMIPFLGGANLQPWMMTLTLNARMLHRFMEELQPHMVIPVHFGTFRHYREPIGEVLKLKDGRIHILKPGDKKNFRISTIFSIKPLQS
jgi:L-ascorbate metabolism protein UlaG (beta-lactamase superfamily)